jgi:hypothetical protein
MAEKKWPAVAFLFARRRGWGNMGCQQRATLLIQTTMRNEFKTADIKIHKDSVGCYTVTHKYQGVLIDGNFYNSRTEARRDAVAVLMQIKTDAEI